MKILLLILVLLISVNSHAYMLYGGFGGSGTSGGGGGATNYIANPGFESALGSSETNTNWQGQTGGCTYGCSETTATRTADTPLAGTYSGWLYTKQCFYYDYGDCYYGCANAGYSAMVQLISGADFRSGATTFQFTIYTSTLASSTEKEGLCADAYDSGNALISGQSNEQQCVKFWGGGWGSSVNTSIAWTPSASTSYTKSFNLYSFVTGNLNSGKTASDIDHVRFYFLNYNGGDMDNCINDIEAVKIDSVSFQ